jgi:tripartite-type tricarboxylate transporter receptor subunit TctC
MKTSASRLILAAILAMAASAWAPVQAQNYPDRTIKLVIPYAPGGSTDLLGRAVAAKMSESMGQAIIVENRG